MQIDKYLSRGADAILEQCLGLCESADERAELLRLMRVQVEDREVSDGTRCEMFCIPIVFASSRDHSVSPESLCASRQDLAKTARSAECVAADQSVMLLDGLYSADDLLGVPMSVMAKATLRAYRRFLAELDGPQGARAMNIPAPLPPPSAMPSRAPSDLAQNHVDSLDVRYLVGFVIGPAASPPPVWAGGDGNEDHWATCTKLRAWAEAVGQALPGCLFSACNPKSLYAGILEGLGCRLGLQLRFALPHSVDSFGAENAELEVVATLHTDAEDRIFAQVGVFARAAGRLMAGVRAPLWTWGEIEGHDSALAMLESVIDNLGVLRVTWMPGTQMDEKCHDCHAPLFMDANGRLQHLPPIPGEDGAPGQLAATDAALFDACVWIGATMH